MSSGESEPQPEATPPAPTGPVGVKVKRRAVMVDGQLVEMDEKDQIGDGQPKPE